MDLSYPAGSKGVSGELRGLKYTSVDTACQRVLELGHGARLTKFDVSGAFGIIQMTVTY